MKHIGGIGRRRGIVLKLGTQHAAHAARIMGRSVTSCKLPPVCVCTRSRSEIDREVGANININEQGVDGRRVIGSGADLQVNECEPDLSTPNVHITRIGNLKP